MSPLEDQQCTSTRSSSTNHHHFEDLLYHLPNDIKREILAFFPSLHLNQFQNMILDRKILFSPSDSFAGTGPHHMNYHSSLNESEDQLMSRGNYSVNYRELIRLLYGYFPDESSFIDNDDVNNETSEDDDDETPGDGNQRKVKRNNPFLIFQHIDLTVYHGKGDFMSIFTDEYVRATVPWYHVKSLLVAPGHPHHFERLTSDCIDLRPRNPPFVAQDTESSSMTALSEVDDDGDDEDGEENSNNNNVLRHYSSFPNLNFLSLMGNSNITDRAVDHIIHQFPNLRHVNVSGTKCSYKSIVRLLRMNRYQSVLSNGIWGMSVKGHHLQDLIYTPKTDGGDGVQSSVPSTSTMHPNNNNNDNDDTEDAVPLEENYEPDYTLTALELHRNQIGGEGMVSVLKKFRRLERLRIGHNQLTHWDMKQLELLDDASEKDEQQYGSHLRMLDLTENSDIGYTGVRTLIKSPILSRLTTLSVSDCSISDNLVGQLLSDMKHLKRLDISSNELLTYRSMVYLEKLGADRSLTYFNASFNPNMFNAGHLDRVARAMSKVQVSQYTLIACDLTDELFVQLNKCTRETGNKVQVQQFQLDENTAITIRGMSELIHACEPSHLTSLLLDGCKEILTPGATISTRMIAQQFNSLQNLTFVELARVSGCNDQFAIELIQHNHHLKALGMNQTSIGNAFVKRLAQIQAQAPESMSLEKLNMKFNRRINSEAICELIRCNHTLILIDIEGAMMDQNILETIDEFQKEQHRYVTIDASVKLNVALKFRQLIDSNYCLRRCSIFY